MSTRDTSNQFGEDHRLTKTSTTEQTSFTTTNKGCKQIDNLNSGFKQFRASRQFSHQWCIAMNRSSFICIHITTAINRFAQQVEYTTEGLFTNRH